MPSRQNRGKIRYQVRRDWHKFFRGWKTDWFSKGGRHICQIILFGSVIESRCTDDSDVDMLVISDTPRSKLYKDKGYQEFLRRLHEKDDYDQLYDVICVHNQEELHRNQNTTSEKKPVFLIRLFSQTFGRPSPAFESPPSECLNISSYCAATPETPRSTA